MKTFLVIFSSHSYIGNLKCNHFLSVFVEFDQSFTKQNYEQFCKTAENKFKEKYPAEENERIASCTKMDD